MSADPLEKIIRPIVEGQIRGFLKEHPSIIKAVDWYKPRTDKEKTFVNSLSKRIVRDLLCANSKARIRAALLECKLEARPSSTVASRPCGEQGPSGRTSGWSLAARFLSLFNAEGMR